MKVAIIYDSKTGTTAECANLLAQRLDDADVFDLAQETPILSLYDKIVIGGYVRYGGINTSSRDFITDNEDQLLNKDISCFLCCIERDKAEHFVHKFYAKKIVKKIKLVGSFGATLPIDQLKGISKIVAKSYLKKLPAPPAIDTAAIDRFAEELKK